MFHSIRWRLVTSYVLLTLLAMSLVGVLAVSLVEHYAAQQESEDLEANAEAVARRAAPLMLPVVRRFELQGLAHTAAFLGGARVRILDEDGRLLADSGPRGSVDELLWISATEAPADPRMAELFASVMAVPPAQAALGVRIPEDELLLPVPLPASELTLVRRRAGAWGNRFAFEEVPAGLPSAEQLQDVWELEAPAETAEPVRSERVMAIPIAHGDRQIGTVELSLGPDFSAEALAATRRAFGFAAAGATVVAALVGLFVSRGLTAPLSSLADAANRMSAGDLSARAFVRSNGEIGQLARQFNQMAAGLEASFAALAAERDALRRFIADASHELRTPITALKTFNELLQSAAASDTAARGEFLAESQAQLYRLEWMTRNLLDLSRLDAGLVSLDLAAHDVGEAIEAALAPFQARAQERGITLEICLPDPPLDLRCDRARVESALSNLLDNALKFTPPGGRVTTGAQGADGIVRLWVRDTGPGIDPADRPYLFERFYRGRSVRAPGSGLGLSIVQSVAQAHGGGVFVESEPGAGSCFTIELPTA